MRSRVFMCAAALAALCLIPAQAQKKGPSAPASWVDADRGEPAGTQYKTFFSKTLGAEVSYLLYLPPGYGSEAGKRYPVIYWLHGLGGNQATGARVFLPHLDAAIKSRKAPPAIVVLVNGMRDGFYSDSRDGKWPVEGVIVKDLIPHVDKTYATIARREARAVEGYSMGGFGAAHLGFKYPDTFGLVSIMAGALLDGKTLASRHPPIVTKMYGDDLGYFQANHPVTLVEKNLNAIRGKTRVRIAVGGEDRLLEPNRAFHELLDRHGVAHGYEVVPGVAHNGALFYEKLGAAAFGFYRDGF